MHGTSQALLSACTRSCTLLRVLSGTKMFRNLHVSASNTIRATWMRPQMRQRLARVKHPSGLVSETTFADDTDYKLHKLDSGPSRDLAVTRDDALKFYKQMLTIRCVDTVVGLLYSQRFARGPCALSSGQEAICVGIEGVLRKTDAVITAYRINGWAYLRGIPLARMMAEITGRASGCSQGKGGAMHMYGNNFYGGHGIVGSQVPLGAGIALAMKYQGTDNVCVTSYGDGAANQGQVFEAYNMAKLWDLPCIFVCENNQYGKWTSVGRASASTEFYTRGDYIPGIWVDGMNVLAVREAARFATEYCRSGKGPIILECDTHLYCNHLEGEKTSNFRKYEEIQMYGKLDPINTFKERLLSSDLAAEEDINEVDKAVNKEVWASVVTAKSDPAPAISELFTHVYKENPVNYKFRGCDAFSFVKVA